MSQLSAHDICGGEDGDVATVYTELKEDLSPTNYHLLLVGGEYYIHHYFHAIYICYRESQLSDSTSNLSHNNNNTTIMSLSDLKPHEKLFFKCPECKYQTLHKSNLKEHGRKHSNLMGVCQEEQSVPNVSTICS